MWRENLQNLININSYTKNKHGVDHVVQYMRELLEPLGFETTLYPRELIGDHILFSSNRRAGKRVLLLGHNDTVFPPGTFEGYREDEEWVYGPGVCDMKGGNIVAYEALKVIHAEFGAIHNIDFLLVSDEETGSDDSKLLTASLAKAYDYCFVFEAAGAREEVVDGRKGVGTFTIDIKGKAAHAGNCYIEGVDANLEASHKLQALVALTDLTAGTTLNVGKIEGGIGANTISPHASILFELRYTQTQERDRVLAEIEKIVATSYTEGTTAHLGGGIQRDVMEPNSKQQALLAQIKEIIGEALTTEQRGGVSDANIVASSGVVTLDGFGPFGDGDHTVNERAKKSSFSSRIEMMSKILRVHQQGGL
jgi:glutamate carboxypeptidase